MFWEAYEDALLWGGPYLSIYSHPRSSFQGSARKRRTTREPQTRQGLHKKLRRDLRRDDTPEDDALLALTSSFSSCTVDSSVEGKLSNLSHDEITEQLSLSDSSNHAAPLCASTPCKSGSESYNPNQSSIVEGIFNESFPAANLSIQLFTDEAEVQCTESLENYVVIDKSPNDAGEFDALGDLDVVNFDVPSDNYVVASDDEDIDMGVDELLKYCQEEDEDAERQVSEITNFLREWSVENSITLLALSRLAAGLKQLHPTCFGNLPVDGRTIMRTPVQKLNIVKVPPGECIHLGVRKQLNFIGSILEEEVEDLGLLFNIDGVKLYKHTSFSLYPILMMVQSCKSLKNKVFPVTLYYGEGRPRDMRLFLQPFIDEMIQLLTCNDFQLKGRVVKIFLLGFCCDTPARSEILETVGHSGFYSCFRCVTRGKSITLEPGKGNVRGKKRKQGAGTKRNSTKRIFPSVQDPPREDIKFRNKEYHDHQPAKRPLTPLVDLPGLHFPRSFILDPMHLVFIGVTKSILSILFLGGRHMLSPSLRQKVQKKLDDCAPYLPSDFPRKPSKIRNVGTCKAAEARIYLFYLGPVILRNSVDRNKYIHFMELSVAMRIYHNVTMCANAEARKLAKDLVQHFVTSVPELYGEEYSSHNMHSLYHLPDDIEWFKDSIPDFTANDISAFPPENFNQVFRRFTRGYAKPLQQNFRRLAELFESDFWRQKYKKSMATSDKIQFQKNHSEGPLPLFLMGQQYKSAIFPCFSLSTNLADCTCGTECGKVIIALNFVEDAENNEQYVVGMKFEVKSEFFDDPLPKSGKLGIYKVSKLSRSLDKWPVSSITTKYVRLPYVKDDSLPEQYRKEEYIVLPLLHSEAGPSTS
ncbi:unnamed protein product [Bemisia tabaci]|uniref:Transposase domain-containing protein n=1 Tax=Bemisia tabaci TaxID=7038 RepID=A0A9P0F1G1_BEMTA|nr:unnamed protein product [Bemisia tabaci]